MAKGISGVAEVVGALIGLEGIDKACDAPAKHVLLPCEIRIRESTASPPESSRSALAPGECGQALRG